jgi:hypothetical protein
MRGRVVPGCGQAKSLELFARDGLKKKQTEKGAEPGT